MTNQMRLFACTAAILAVIGSSLVGLRAEQRTQIAQATGTPGTPLQATPSPSPQAEKPADRPIFILDEAMGRCIDPARATKVGHANRREWWLVPREAIVEGCVPDASVDEAQGKENAPEP